MRKREVASSYAYRGTPRHPLGCDRREPKLPREGDAPARSVGARGNPNNREQPKKPRRLYKHKRRRGEYWVFEKSGTDSVPPKCLFLIGSVSYPKNRVIFAERRKNFCRKFCAFSIRKLLSSNARKKPFGFFRVAFRFSLRENRREFLLFFSLQNPFQCYFALRII